MSVDTSSIAQVQALSGSARRVEQTLRAYRDGHARPGGPQDSVWPVPAVDSAIQEFVDRAIGMGFGGDDAGGPAPDPNSTLLVDGEVRNVGGTPVTIGGVPVTHEGKPVYSGGTNYVFTVENGHIVSMTPA